MVLITSAFVLLKSLGISPAKIIGGELSKAAVAYFKKSLTANPSYEKRLIEIIDTLLAEYRESYKPDPLARTMYFWQSQWLWETALTYRLYSDNSTILVEQLPALQNLIVPSQAELDTFSQRLADALENDDKLRNLYEEENYKSEIFRFAKYSTEQFTAIIQKLDLLQDAPAADAHLLLDIIEQKQIRHYQPSTALVLLEELERIIVTRQASNGQLRARLHYLMGFCLQETQQSKKADEQFIKAYSLQPDNLLYAEQAALTHAKASDSTAAQATLTQVRLLATDSPIDWAITTFFHSGSLEECLAAVPVVVARSEHFKQALLELLIPASDVDEIVRVVREEVQHYTTPADITFDNRRFQGTLASIVAQVELNAIPQVHFLSEFKPITDRPRLNAVYETIAKCVGVVYHTEKFPFLSHMAYLEGLTGFLTTGDIGSFNKFQQLYTTMSLTARQPYIWGMACALFQAGQHEQVLTLLDENTESVHPEADFVRAMAYERLSKPVEAKASMVAHLQSVTTFSELTFTRAIIYLDTQCSTIEERQDFYTGCKARGQFANELQELLLRAQVYYPLEERRDEVDEWLAQAEEKLTVNTEPVYRLQLGQLFNFLQDYTASMRVLSDLSLFPPDMVLAAQHIILVNRYLLYDNSAEIREELRAWRLNHGVEGKFCSWEIQLAEPLPDWERIKEVALAVREVSSFAPDFTMYYLLALHRLGNQQELEQALQALVANPAQMRQQQLLSVANLAMEAGFSELSLALLYPLASNRKNLTFRDQFFMLAATDGSGREKPDLERAVVGSVVYYSVNEDLQEPLHLTEEAVAEDGLATQMLNKQAGDTFEVEEPMLHRMMKLKIQQIVDPYTALLRDIVEQTKRQRVGMKLQAIEFAGPSPEEMKQTFIEMFGAAGLARKVEADNILAQYEAGEVGFSVVAGVICHGNGLDAYRFLQSADGPGMHLVPRLTFQQVQLQRHWTYVLDWSSLPLFYQLEKSFGLQLPESLWVSVHLIDFLKELVQKKRRQIGKELSVTIIGNELRGHSFPDDARQREEDFLRDLLAWVQKHCKTRLVPEKLDMVRQMKSLDGKGTDYSHYMMDTFFLANHPETILISDDLTLFTLLAGNAAIVSTEKFLHGWEPTQYQQTWLPELLKRRYIGLAINQEVLYEQFIANKGQFIGTAYQCLLNLGEQMLTEPNVSQDAFAFLRKVYLMSTLLPAQKDQAAINVFSTCLRHAQLTPQVKTIFRAMLNQLFYLLPDQKSAVLNAFEQAWAIALHGRSG